MDKLDCLRTFLEVVRHGNFTFAAEHLGISKASASNQVAALEQTFGATLIARTTKQVALTQAGEQIFGLAAKLLADYGEMLDSVGRLEEGVKGTLRIGVPPSFGARYLTPMLLEFAAQYPLVEIKIFACNTIDQFTAQGLDVAIIVAQTLPDSSHKAFLLAESPQVLVAAKTYLDRCEPIKTPEDLKRCNCLVNLLNSPGSIWRFKGPFGVESVHVHGTLSASVGEVIKQAALLGHGIAMHPYYMFAGEIESGQLCRVLPEYEPHSTSIHVLYSNRDLMPARTTCLLDFLRGWAKQPKIWESPVPADVHGNDL